MYRSVCAAQNYYFAFLLTTPKGIYVVIKRLDRKDWKLKLLKFRFKPFDKSCCLENLISGYHTRRWWQVHEMLMWKCTIPSRHEGDEFQSRFLIKNVFWNSTWLNYSSSFSTPNQQRHAIHHFSKLLHHEQLHKQLAQNFRRTLRTGILRPLFFVCSFQIVKL